MPHLKIDIEKITSDTTFKELDIDSMELLEIFMYIEKSLNTDLDLKFKDTTTINELANKIEYFLINSSPKS